MSGNDLDHAVFSLSRLDEEGHSVETWDEFTMGEKVIDDLVVGRYKLTENRAPAGYVIENKDHYFLLSMDSENQPVLTLVNEANQEVSYDYAKIDTEGLSIIIKNPPGVALPATGGITTMPIYVLGTFLTLLGMVMLLRQCKG